MAFLDASFFLTAIALGGSVAVGSLPGLGLTAVWTVFFGSWGLLVQKHGGHHDVDGFPAWAYQMGLLQQFVLLPALAAIIAVQRGLLPTEDAWAGNWEAWASSGWSDGMEAERQVGRAAEE